MMGTAMERTLLFSASNISKAFGGTQALEDVSLELFSGEIVGLIGENGAGKSTLLKIIQGVQPPDSGTMALRGNRFAPQNPKESGNAGISMVFQEQSLITNLTVGQNIFFAREKEFRKFGIVQWGKLYKETEAVLKSLGLDYINPRKRVIELDFADRQMVEIAKAINNSRTNPEEKSLILLDEPTSVLNEKECSQLFEEIRKLKADGNAVVFISHRLDEVLKISDRICIFKNGKKVGDMANKNVDETNLYEMMVGKESSAEYYHIDKQIVPEDEVVLGLKGLGLFGSFKNISFDLKKGEVFGICGVAGSGIEDICACVCGNKKPTSGTISVFGKQAKLDSPAKALKYGILSVPKWRNEEGIMGMLSISDNITMSNFEKIRSGPLLSPAKQKEQANEWVGKLDIKCPNASVAVQQLSGGNVQKVVFARVLASGAKIIVLNHPTRGVDVGAKEEIYSLIRDITKSGISVIILGDTIEECIGMSNRIMVMKDGYMTKMVDACPENKPEQSEIIRHMV